MSGDKETFDRLSAWLKTNAVALLADKENDVVAVGIGKESRGPVDDDSEFCITAFVDKKAKKTETVARASIKNLSTSEASGPNFAIDIVNAGSGFTSLPRLSRDASQRGKYGGPAPSIDLQKRFDRVRAGVGLTNPEREYPNSLSVGTLGFFVEDDQGIQYLVSNNHVIAHENSAVIGDHVVQPGTLDLTSTELSMMGSLAALKKQLSIATLAAWIDINFGAGGQNDVDCALAEVNAKSRNFTEASRIGLGSTCGGLAPNYVVGSDGAIKGSTRVYKAGRTTGMTEGEVIALNVVSNVTYGAGVASFRNQIAIRPGSDNGGDFSAAGHSGSGIFDERNRLVGLLFAGSGFQTLANPARMVISALETKLGRGKLKVVS